MKNLRFFSGFLIFALIIALIGEPSAKSVEEFDVAAGAAVLMDADSGEVFYSKNPHEPRPPASTTKLMVGLLAMEAVESGAVSLNDKVTASENARFDLTWDSSTAGIQPGEVMTLNDLLYCALVISANEACNVIAEYISGDVASFVQLMNHRAMELGCKDTNFVNTHGLPHVDHLSSAYDLALIARESLKHPTLVQITDT
ncbi:MAG: serine hydrolase, partial [Oscillospiraceae bacterium]|nr:serine hydrolase [Oscillospiraceae bacterium]